MIKKIPYSVSGEILCYMNKVYSKIIDNNSRFPIFSPDGKYIVSCSYDNIIKLWDVVCNIDTSIGIAGKCIKTFIGHTDWIHSAEFSPDGKYIVSYSSDKTIKLWDAVCNTDTSIGIAGNCIKTFTGHTDWIRSAKFSPDGKYIVSCSSDKTIKLWDAADINTDNNECIKTFTGHTDWVFLARFSPDGKYIVSCSADDTIKLWDASVDTSIDNECIKTFIGHTDLINSARFSPDGKYIVSCSEDNTIKLWSVVDTSIDNNTSIGNECIKTLIGHTDWVNSAEFSPDGKYIVSCSDDRTIKLWNTDINTDIKCIKTFTGHTKFVYSVEFSPDGKYIVSCSADNTIKLWRVSNDIIGDNNTNNCIKTLTGHTDWVASAKFSPDGQSIVACLDRTIRLLYI
jgi:WD40 repeat protein